MSVTVKSSKKKNTTSLFVGAIIFGVFAALLSMWYLKVREDDLRARLEAKKEELVAVVVATNNLPKGSQISSQNMAVRNIPRQFVYEGSVKPGEFPSYEGLYLAEALTKGTPLLKTLVKREVASDFSDTIKEGRRAITIQVDEIKTISGFIRPGNHIDIFAKISGEKSDTDNGLIMPVLQDVVVLATGKSAAGDFAEKYIYGGNQNPFSYTTLTLDVSPKQGALLSMGEDLGELVAMLRNRKDVGGASFSQLLPSELYNNAQTMLSESFIKQQAKSADNVYEIMQGDLVIKDGRVYDKFGNWIEELVVQADGSVTTRDGRLVMTADGQVQPGFILTKDGKLITDPNVIIKNGVLMTKDGVVLSGRGLSVDKNGNLITADGKVVDAGNLITSPDGRLITKDGTVLADTNVILGKDGRKLSSSDVRITKDGFIVMADGTVMTKDGKVLEGVTVDADGNVIAADGTILKANEITVNADGTVTGKDGMLIAGLTAKDDPIRVAAVNKLLSDGMRKTDGGFIVDKDGNVMLPDGTILKGVTIGADGKVRSADGKILKADGLTVNSDGSITGADGKKIAGLIGDRTSAKAKVMQALLSSRAGVSITRSGSYEFIVGGSSDGISKKSVVPIGNVQEGNK